MTVGLRKKSLLVVEDNQPMQEMLRDIATGASFDVTALASRDDAFDAIRRRRFDAAFVDLRLYELDENNQDGLDVISRLHDLNEGTFYVLLTAYGSFGIAAKATEMYKAHVLEKGKSAEFLEGLQKLFREAMNASSVNRFEPALAWSGDENPEVWSSQAHSILGPRGDYGITGALLHELLLTADPILDRIGSRGLEKVPDHAALAGLYWSRGVGEAVIVIAARDAIPSPVPTLPHWPAITIHEDICPRATKKNLVGAIIRCSGVEPEDFPVKRSYLE